jgi:hypothetical protein
MVKLLGLLVIAAIFFVAWIFGKKKTIVGIDKDSFQTIPEAAGATHIQKKDQVSGKLFKRVYPIINQRNKERKEKHWMRVYEYRLLGIHWTPFGLYWETRQLAEDHK